jgi:CHAT domain-containing protein
MDDYSIVHLATHAAFLPGSPLDSFILLGNGETITLQEVQDEWFFSNLDLIVLSACQTAVSSLGDSGEEILGFGYLMQNAGVNAAMASLWTVDDGGTQTLMSAFYANLLQTGVTKTEALRQAQLSLIHQGNSSQSQPNRGITLIAQNNETEPQTWSRLSHPYYWSPFVLIGNGL